VPADDLDELVAAAEVEASDREVGMAKQLIDSLTTAFEPQRYHDEYREKVLELIERKAQGEEIAVQPDAPAPAKVPDLMAALEASLAAVKSESAEPAAKPAAAKKKPAAAKKKPATKAA
jgi:DNA end-binding protein Ku